MARRVAAGSAASAGAADEAAPGEARAPASPGAAPAQPQAPAAATGLPFPFDTASDGDDAAAGGDGGGDAQLPRLRMPPMLQRGDHLVLPDWDSASCQRCGGGLLLG